MNITISEARSFINNGVDRILRYYYVHTFTFICKLQLSFNTFTWFKPVQCSARPNNNNILFDLMLLTFHKEEHTHYIHYNITHISLCACLCCDALMCSAGLAFVFYVIA